MTTESIQPIEAETEPSSAMARRGILAAAAGASAAAVLALKGGVASASSRPSPSQEAPSESDLATAGVAAGLEVLAVNTYGAALDAATSGALGAVPPAVAEYVTTAQAHHQAALDAWNGVLTANGRPAVTEPPADLATTVNDQFAMVTDIAGAAQLALGLEQIAAATYLAVLGTLQAPAAIELAGSIQPIDRQHISVLLFALGMYPVPETFAPTDIAYSGSGAPAPGAMPGAMPETS